ncbi:ArnT family glycosyltransferase [Limnobacter parvus]|uniref:Glycosyltransferase family 39 protein n=1 Tax=Limnobacter parvus TaxID=2939690 RepID=A0ABT1XIA1_9BURK|nr:glycosyltransferase family 39 protein [Limnobacter parvus]MCR2746313.1 glycosyltransferase family 39 protein [Limnobacter parvus]
MRTELPLRTARSVFWSTVLVTTLIKIWLAYFFPMTGDEAFFHLWSTDLSWGYYDHPPMIGWWLWGLSHIGNEPIVIRSLTMLLTTVIAGGVVLLARELLPAAQEARAWLAGAVYLSMPVSWFAVFVTTDTPLIFFMGLSIFTYARAIRSNSGFGIFLAGCFLGLAFLSKYFAVLLGFAFGMHLLFQPQRVKYLLLLMAGVLPFASVNIGYNLHNCWNNIMFNLVNRHEDAQLGWGTVFTYLGMMLYLLTPWALWSLLKGVRAWSSQSALFFALLVPLTLFFLISLNKTVGLHWVLGFLPIAFVLLALCASTVWMRRYVWFNAALSFPHLVLFGLLMHANAGVWPTKDFQEDVRFHREMPAILANLTQDMPPDGVLTTIAYSPAALMTYHHKQVVPVFGPGKYHARNDDTFVDWRNMNGKPIRIVAKAKPIDAALYSDYLSDVRVQTRDIQGVPFTIVDGTNFNYEQFRNVVLREAVEKYYQIPSVLPVLDCPFARKYGFEEECRVGDLGLFK